MNTQLEGRLSLCQCGCQTQIKGTWARGHNNKQTYAQTLSRFFEHVHTEPNSGCWIWCAALVSGGRYGGFSADGRDIRAHRFSYLLLKGPIPPGKELDHLCRTTVCVNPDHLEPVSHKENMRRGKSTIQNLREYWERHGLPELIRKNKEKVCCTHGHSFSGDNLYIRPNGNRACRLCQRLASHRSKQKRRGILRETL